MEQTTQTGATSKPSFQVRSDLKTANSSGGSGGSSKSSLAVDVTGTAEAKDVTEPRTSFQVRSGLQAGSPDEDDTNPGGSSKAGLAVVAGNAATSRFQVRTGLKVGGGDDDETDTNDGSSKGDGLAIDVTGRGASRGI